MRPPHPLPLVLPLALCVACLQRPERDRDAPDPPEQGSWVTLPPKHVGPWGFAGGMDDDGGDDGGDTGLPTLDGGPDDTGNDEDSGDGGSDTGEAEAPCDGLTLDIEWVGVWSDTLASDWPMTVTGCATGITVVPATVSTSAGDYTATVEGLPDALNGAQAATLTFTGPGVATAPVDLEVQVATDQGDLWIRVELY